MVTHNTSTSLQGSLSLPIRGCNGSLCSNMEIFTLNITRVVWPHVTNLLDLRYFCQHNPLFYHLNLIPCHYWSWQRNIYFLVNIFVRHTFSMSKSSIKTKTVLTMIFWGVIAQHHTSLDTLHLPLEPRIHPTPVPRFDLWVGQIVKSSISLGVSRMPVS